MADRGVDHARVRRRFILMAVGQAPMPLDLLIFDCDGVLVDRSP
jgi:hypothetical protein